MHYLLGSLLLLAIWLLIFISQKKLRKEMLIASLIITPAALSELFFVPGYWLPDTIGNPKLSIEDFIFTFAVGGIVAVLYELFMKGKIKHQRLCNCFNEGIFPGLILGVGVIAIFLAYTIFNINFMYAVYIGIIINIILITITRPDLIKKVIYSGLLFGLFYFLFFSAFAFFVPDFILHWNINNLSGLILRGVPFEEIVWAFGVGALLGPIYEYLLSIKLAERR
ncbi:MAG: lycopene cyclase domain-containing protein [Candidatus Daviesbacteria bacterium]|nr:lycopene cyclase domain-containing protein [Candidatus Daviesbacteria bacterium]